MPSTYLLISPEDFLTNKRKGVYSDRFEFMESVLRYLERYDIPHVHSHDSICIYPTDHFHAWEISDHLRLTKPKYFVNGKASKLFEIKKCRGSISSSRSYGSSFNLIANNKGFRSFLIDLPVRSMKNGNKKIELPAQSSFQIQKPFIGTFVDFKPRLGLFGPIECAVQGSFI